MITADYLGFVAGTITTISFVPQVIRTYRSKSGRDISAWMMVLLGSGTMMWLLYGLMLRSVPIVAANGVTFLLVLTILLLKIYYGRAKVSPESY
jgi:MtN3 and saliva related transmembrane protein